MIKENPMGKRNLLPLLLTMALPAMFSMLIQSLYNIVDSYFVSLISEQAFRAVTIAMPAQQVIVAAGVGMGVGVSSLVSRSLGAKNYDRANSVANHGYFITLVSSLLFFLFATFFAKSFYRFFSDDIVVIEEGSKYLFIVLSLSLGQLALSMSEKLLQGTGDMLRPMLMQLTGAIFNIILDPILIFGFGLIPPLGVKGAAIATVISQWIGLVLAIIMLYKDTHEVKISFKSFKLDFEIIKGIFMVGIPQLLIISITSVLVMTLNKLLLDVNEILISVLGVYFRLQSFVFMPVFGLTQAMMPIVGYNFGYGDKKRVIRVLLIAMAIASIIMIMGLFLFQFKSEFLLSIFNAEGEMMSYGIQAMKIISLSFVFAGINICFSNFFQGLGLGQYSLTLTLLRQFFIIIPLVFIFRYKSLELSWTAFIIAEFVSMIYGVFIYRTVFNNIKIT